MKTFSELSKLKMLLTGLIAIQLMACQQGPGRSRSNQDGTQTSTQSATAAPAERKTSVTTQNGIVIEVKKKTDLRADRANLEEFKKHLNVYVAKIKIPEEIFVGELRIAGSVNASALSPHYNDIPKSRAIYEDGYYFLIEELNLWDEDLSPKQVTYKLISNEETLDEASFALIPDLLVPTRENTAMTLSSLGIHSGQYQFGVIFFEKGSLLNTQGATVKFQTERLIADDAKIESFSAEQAGVLPSVGEAGRSGGRVVIQAVAAQGRLTFEMRGTTGGKGYPAPAQLQQRGPSGPGAPAATEHYCEAPVLKNGPQGVWGVANRMMRGCRTICVRSPGDGLPGERGFDGNPGGSGAVGGSSGLVELYIEKQAPEFHAQVFHRPGAGGPGGEGSPGAPGGEGGAAGEDFRVCPKARKGPTGPQGLFGATGTTGAVGMTEVSQIIIAGQKVL